jgi:hypothetical protein
MNYRQAVCCGVRTDNTKSEVQTAASRAAFALCGSATAEKQKQANFNTSLDFKKRSSPLIN